MSPQYGSGTQDEQILLTRRRFLYAGAGLGVAAVAAGGAAAFGAYKKAHEDDGVPVLTVPESNVLSLDDYEIIENYELVASLVGNFELPYGTLVWCSTPTVACCLLPTEGAKPLTQVSLLMLGSGSNAVMLKQAVGLNEGFEIYDCRASEKGIVWTEADILDGIWRIYGASLSSGFSLGDPKLLDEGSAYDWETPTIAAVGGYAFWQVLPQKGGSQAKSKSVLKRAQFGSKDSQVMWESTGRMSTPPYAGDDFVVITPRTDDDTVHYQLTCLDASSGEVRDSMVLPQSMKPLEAGWGSTGFNFSFESIYNYGGGIANLGTYTPTSKVSGSEASNATWFRFPRTPTAAPAWCNNWFIVKSTSAVCGVNTKEKRYFALDVKSGADSYGDYLASTGMSKTFVTYSNIDYAPISGDAVKQCNVRVWSV